MIPKNLTMEQVVGKKPLWSWEANSSHLTTGHSTTQQEWHPALDNEEGQGQEGRGLQAWLQTVLAEVITL